MTIIKRRRRLEDDTSNENKGELCWRKTTSVCYRLVGYCDERRTREREGTSWQKIKSPFSHPPSFFFLRWLLFGYKDCFINKRWAIFRSRTLPYPQWMDGWIGWSARQQHSADADAAAASTSIWATVIANGLQARLLFLSHSSQHSGSRYWKEGGGKATTRTTTY